MTRSATLIVDGKNKLRSINTNASLKYSPIVLATYALTPIFECITSGYMLPLTLYTGGFQNVLNEIDAYIENAVLFDCRNGNYTVRRNNII